MITHVCVCAQLTGGGLDVDALVLEAHDQGPEGRLLDVGGEGVEGRVGQNGVLDGVVYLFMGVGGVGW